MNTVESEVSPVACSLDGKAFRQRVEGIKALADRALISLERLEASLVLRFDVGDEAMEKELRDLVALERQCCAFLTIDLMISGSDATLTVSGPPQAASLLQDVFGGSITDKPKMKSL